MASGNGTVTIAQKYGLPQFNEDGDFDSWVRDMELWGLVTDLDAKKRGPVVFLSLSLKVRQACSSLSKEELNADDGLQKLIEKLKELYGLTEDQSMFNAYEKFETFQRPKTMSISDYVNKFEELNQKLRAFKIELPTAVLAYQLLKNANLPKATRDLTRATVPTLKYDDMKKQIKAIYDQCAQSDDTLESSDSNIDVEQDIFYGVNSYARNGRGYNSNPQVRRGSRNNPNFSRSKSGNPVGADGQQLQCHICKSVMHFSYHCPHKDKGKKSDSVTKVDVHFFTDEVEQCFMEQVVSESLNCALLDSGCSSTVCGKNWLSCYIDTLPENVDLQVTQSNKSFKFGPGQQYNSLKQVNLPVNINGMQARLLTDVVDCEIPLLLSKQSMKAANSCLDFEHDTVTMFGIEIPLQHTSGGHYCIPLTPKQVIVNSPCTNDSVQVTFTVSDMSTKSLDEKKKIAVKLHKQFGHPIDGNKLKTLLKNANVDDKELYQLIDDVTNSCDTCSR